MTEARVHHIGYVVASIANSVEDYGNATGLSWSGRIIHDPLQMVSVAFLGSGEHGSAMIELVQPAGARSPVNRFLEEGGGLHHVCLVVPDLRLHLESCQAAGSTLVRVPMAAAAFGGRKIAWIKTAGGQLVELLQA